MASRKAVNPTPAQTPATPAPSVSTHQENLPDPLFVDIREAARRLGFTVWAMRNLVWGKKIRFVKRGRRKYFFSPADLKAYAERLLAESSEVSA
jgi:excisionase family DNA binding protein